MNLLTQLKNEAHQMNEIIKSIHKLCNEYIEYIDYSSVAGKIAHIEEVSKDLFEFALDADFVLFDKKELDGEDLNLCEFFCAEFDNCKYTLFLIEQEAIYSRNYNLSLGISSLIKEAQSYRKDIILDLDKFLEVIKKKEAA